MMKKLSDAEREERRIIARKKAALSRKSVNPYMVRELLSHGDDDTFIGCTPGCDRRIENLGDGSKWRRPHHY